MVRLGSKETDQNLPTDLDLVIVRAAIRVKDLDDGGKIVLPRRLLQNVDAAAAAAFACGHGARTMSEIAVDVKAHTRQSGRRIVLRLHV